MRWLFDRLGLKRRDNEDGWIVKGLPHDIKLEPFGVTAFATALKAADLIADKWDECIGSLLILDQTIQRDSRQPGIV
jgi:hypothetical protein